MADDNGQISDFEQAWRESQACLDKAIREHAADAATLRERVSVLEAELAIFVTTARAHLTHARCRGGTECEIGCVPWIDLHGAVVNAEAAAGAWEQNIREQERQAHAAELAAVRGESLVGYLKRQREWSARTFGPGTRLMGILKHIRKELGEIEADPTSVEEWCDVVMIALDGAWRAGHEPAEIMQQLQRKQIINAQRRYPPPGPQDEPMEHIRGDSQAERRAAELAAVRGELAALKSKRQPSDYENYVRIALDKAERKLDAERDTRRAQEARHQREMAAGSNCADCARRIQERDALQAQVAALRIGFEMLWDAWPESLILPQGMSLGFAGSLIEDTAAAATAFEQRIKAPLLSHIAILVHLLKLLHQRAEPSRDHACLECVGEGDLVKDGFQCAWHAVPRAIAAAIREGA